MVCEEIQTVNHLAIREVNSVASGQLEDLK